MFVSAATLTFDEEQKHQLESFYRLGRCFRLFLAFSLVYLLAYGGGVLRPALYDIPVVTLTDGYLT